MDFFARIGAAIFGRDNNPTEIQDMFDAGVDVLTSPAPRANSTFEYHFNVAPLPRNPGPAYISALLQFQEYPRNNVQGAGYLTNPNGYFRAFAPLDVVQINTPIPSGTSGVQTGGLRFGPLLDTSGVVS